MNTLFVRHSLGYALALSLLFALVGTGTVHAAGVVGTGTPESCDEAALDAALAGGGLVTFDCGASPVTITVTNTKTIAVDTTIDGTGQNITISGNHAVQVMVINTGVSLTLQKLTVADGSASLGGGILNSGNLIVTGSTFSGNSAAANGGAIYNNFQGGLATLKIDHSIFSTNSAQGDPNSGAGFGGAIYNGARLTVIDSTFSNNSAAFGAAIDDQGSTEVTNSTLSGNTASLSGGGIYTEGALHVTNSTFSANTANFGGGIYNNASPVDVADSTFSGNSVIYLGGGMYSEYSSSLNVNNSTFANNSADSGGGMYSNGNVASTTNSTYSANTARSSGGGLYSSGTLSDTNSTFSGNLAQNGGAIASSGTLMLTLSTIINNMTRNGGDGGGISSSGVAGLSYVTVSGNTANDTGGILNSGTMTINNSTISGNRADTGGAFTNNSSGTLTINNSTVSGNIGNVNGAVFENHGMVYLTNATVSGNTAPFGSTLEGNFTLANTIVANNAPNNCSLTSTVLTSKGHNLSSDKSCSKYFRAMGDKNNTNPQLGLLANNGGPTFTTALLPGSPAIDAGDNAICAAQPINNLDQRGVARPLNGDGKGQAICDIGAYEAPTITKPK